MIFIINKYLPTYLSIIGSAVGRDKFPGSERHHIIPKSLGGSNHSNNLVFLTYREHITCHKLLKRVTISEAREKMSNALWRMCCGGQSRYNISSRQYEKLRKEHSIRLSAYLTGRPSPTKGRRRKPMSDEAKRKSSQTKKERIHPSWNKGISRTETERQLMSKRRLETAAIVGAWNKGKPHSQETLDKITERARNRIVLTCEHCGKTATGGNYARWHGSKCKLLHL